ncbi:MAG: hypothetical protein US50_C0044G0004 [Candidatus Nomurabacteria bacterium GW2011_GWB1_37_5]|uniref:Adenylate kinase n=1 Tax=Candidatus Nomurabacteria bacterium GW2011_GWB1_37_5 TaxID=1618742 RepID=A0A0G0K1K7_9BACT|nr:MAG: hypothetical protein US50_C0044G0004 [Candidatus Nomurabacteria bacterium GW2011_GWB1_37_5]
MPPQTYIFIGRSGCGKGTQSELLQKYIKENDPEKRTVFYLESGDKFREFISSSGHTASLAREISQTGGLQPAFLAVHIWSHLMIEQMEGNKHVIIDGSPRKLDEAKILSEALNFYGRKPTVVYMNVSRAWAEDKLIKRGRADDIRKEDIQRRLDWFDRDVMPTVEYLKGLSLAPQDGGTVPAVYFLDINGDQTIDEVHREIISKLY